MAGFYFFWVYCENCAKIFKRVLQFLQEHCIMLADRAKRSCPQPCSQDMSNSFFDVESVTASSVALSIFLALFHTFPLKRKNSKRYGKITRKA